MKRTSRLTALVLVLLMLVNISASATTNGISLDELDLATYQTLLAEATEEDGAEMPVISEPCGENNPFCALVSELVTKPTAQARYEYMMSLYGEEETDTTLEGTMLHYFYYKAEHNAEGLICECDFPSLPPEYAPGALNIHEADCPWTFANLSVAEQYSIVCLMTADEGAPYLATLSAEQMTALETYTAQQEEGKLSFPCDEMPEYCQFDVYSQMTATERYNYFNSIYADEDGEISAQYAAIMLHYGEYHLDSNLICTCGDHPLPLPDYRVGDVSKHEADCPWHFNNLTTGEQYTMLQNAASEEEKANYMNSLDGDAAEKLDRVNKTEYTATSEAASVQISAPAGTFAADYILSAESAALNEAQQAAMDELAGLHVLTTFDISFAELMDEANKLQPTTPVQLTFTIDTSALGASTLFVHHLKDNGDGTYTAEVLGEFAVDKSQTMQTVTVSCPSFSSVTLSSDCDGSVENGCGFIQFASMNGWEREAKLLELMKAEGKFYGEQYNVFVTCALEHHSNIADVNKLICLCRQYTNTPDAYHYGDLAHDEVCTDFNFQQVPCPWHFNQISPEDQLIAFPKLSTLDQSTVLGTATEEEKAEYLATLGEEAQGKLDRLNKTEYTADAGADAGANVAISVPEGAFSTNYILNAAAGELSEAQQAAMKALDGMHVIAAFDIAFVDAANEANTLQPAEGKPVQLTFTVDTAKVEGSTLYVHHLKDNGDGTFTAELLQTLAVNKESASQIITADCGAFSAITVSDTCDGEACYTYNGVAYTYNGLMQCTTAEERRTYVNSLYDAALADYMQDATVENPEDEAGGELGIFLAHIALYHWDCVSLLCQCGIYPMPPVGDAAHDVAGCPWASASAGELLEQVKALHGETEVTEWLNSTVVTNDMLELALQATSLNSVLVVNGMLIYVYTGDVLATYNAETGMVKDIATGLQFHMDELTANSEEEQG